MNLDFKIETAPADGTSAADCERRLRYIAALFGQHSDKLRGLSVGVRYDD
jgi:hypothetical protein